MQDHSAFISRPIFIRHGAAHALHIFRACWHANLCNMSAADVVAKEQPRLSTATAEPFRRWPSASRQPKPLRRPGVRHRRPPQPSPVEPTLFVALSGGIGVVMSCRLVDHRQYWIKLTQLGSAEITCQEQVCRGKATGSQNAVSVAHLLNVRVRTPLTALLSHRRVSLSANISAAGVRACKQRDKLLRRRGGLRLALPGSPARVPGDGEIQAQPADYGGEDECDGGDEQRRLTQHRQRRHAVSHLPSCEGRG